MADYHHGNLKESMIESTRTIVQEQGLQALTLRRVASEAGVSAPAAYHHFPSKTHLIAAAAAEALELLDRRLAESGRPDSSPSDRLEDMAVAYVRFALKERGRFMLVFGAHMETLELSKHECVRMPARRSKERLRSAVRDAVAERRIGLDPMDATAILWAQLVGIAELVAQRELGAGFTQARTESLVRAAVRSHLGLISP